VNKLDISRLALTFVGDVGNIQAVEPPEASKQSRLCALYFQPALDVLVADPRAEWGFAKTRVTLAETTNPTSSWAYAYLRPNLCLRVLSVQAADASSDLQTSYPTTAVSQPFATEIDTGGQQLILTNQAGAVCRYMQTVTNVGVLGPLAAEALAWKLASFIAVPLVLGKTGITVKNTCEAQYRLALTRAAEADARDRRLVPEHIPDAIAARG
jgi:hypothetical protein